MMIDAMNTLDEKERPNLPNLDDASKHLNFLGANLFWASRLTAKIIQLDSIIILKKIIKGLRNDLFK